jgi:hypothetical protein|tara:strand:+ start:2049 stop:2378 length:330 start_codon:yes stop_codon:yes gene_type:complete
MANAYKILGQVADASANDVELYLVPASTEAVVSTIVVCNREAANNTFRIATKTDNSAVANTDYVAYDSVINGNDTITLTLGITLQAGAEISVGASDANVTFQAYGTQIT